MRVLRFSLEISARGTRKLSRFLRPADILAVERRWETSSRSALMEDAVAESDWMRYSRFLETLSTPETRRARKSAARSWRARTSPLGGVEATDREASPRYDRSCPKAATESDTGLTESMKL